MESMVVLCQLGLVAMLTGWLALGLRDNLIYPEQNRLLVDMILLLERMEAQYPDFHAQLKHRRVTDARLRRALFRAIVAVEILVVLILLGALTALLGTLAGTIPAEIARTWALAGAFGFTMIWSAFLVGGNHFAYWLCFKEQQYTHFFMMLWGLGTMVFLVAS